MIIVIVTAISILITVACKFLRACGKYKIDCERVYSIKKRAHLKGKL
ncbi:hypothetical protein [Lactococcus petauri]